MKPRLYILTTLFLLASCKNTSYNNEGAIQTRQKTLSEFKNDFKFSNLQEFDIDTYTWETRPGKYKELDSTTFYMVWQNGQRDFVRHGYDSIYEKDYLYSWQERDTNFIEVAILSQITSNWCTEINYFIYDKSGKHIDNFVACSYCGDGGRSFESYGKFIDNRTYEKICVESEVGWYDNTGGREGDSTILHYIIGKNGKVTEKEMYKKHFIEKYKNTNLE